MPVRRTPHVGSRERRRQIQAVRDRMRRHAMVRAKDARSQQRRERDQPANEAGEPEPGLSAVR